MAFSITLAALAYLPSDVFVATTKRRLRRHYLAEMQATTPCIK